MAKKRPPLALFGALSVAHMDSGRVVIARRQRGADTGVHAAAQEDNRALCVLHHGLDVIPNRIAVQPKRLKASQIECAISDCRFRIVD